MRTVKLLTLLSSLTSLLLFAAPQPNGLMTANAGTRFSLSGPDENGVFSHTVDGVAQVSVIGNCLVHFDVLAQPQPNGEWTAEGTMYFLFPNDGSILRLKVIGRLVTEANVEDVDNEVRYLINALSD